jgi:hypothetical protein
MFVRVHKRRQAASLLLFCIEIYNKNELQRALLQLMATNTEPPSSYFSLQAISKITAVCLLPANC